MSRKYILTYDNGMHPVVYNADEGDGNEYVGLGSRIIDLYPDD